MLFVCSFVLRVVGHCLGTAGSSTSPTPAAGMVQKDAPPDANVSLPTWSHLVPSSLIEVGIMGNVDFKWFLL